MPRQTEQNVQNELHKDSQNGRKMKKKNLIDWSQDRFEKRVSLLSEVEGKLSVELECNHDVAYGCIMKRGEELCFVRAFFVDSPEEHEMLFTGLCGMGAELGLMEVER